MTRHDPLPSRHGARWLVALITSCSVAFGVSSSSSGAPAGTTIDDGASASETADRVDPPEPPATTTTTTTTPSEPIAAELDQVLAITNQERAKVGAGPLTLQSQLTRAAQLHSEDQRNRGFIFHTSPEGETMVERVEAQGYSWRALGENVAAGQSSAQQVMNAWMGSDGHRRNLLNPDYTEIGLGLAYDSSGRPYWTQNFGRPWN